MAEATITSKGQVTIPKSVREILELKPHDRVVFIPYGDRVIIRPLKGTILDIRGSVKHEGGHINFKKMREEMKEEVANGIVKEMGGKYVPRRRQRNP